MAVQIGQLNLIVLYFVQIKISKKSTFHKSGSLQNISLTHICVTFLPVVQANLFMTGETES